MGNQLGVGGGYPETVTSVSPVSAFRVQPAMGSIAIGNSGDELSPVTWTWVPTSRVGCGRQGGAAGSLSGLGEEDIVGLREVAAGTMLIRGVGRVLGLFSSGGG